MNCILHKGNFVLHHWGKTSIYRPLFYSFGSLELQAMVIENKSYRKEYLKPIEISKILSLSLKVTCYFSYHRPLGAQRWGRVEFVPLPPIFYSCFKKKK